MEPLRRRRARRDSDRQQINETEWVSLIGTRGALPRAKKQVRHLCPSQELEGVRKTVCFCRSLQRLAQESASQKRVQKFWCAERKREDRQTRTNARRTNQNACTPIAHTHILSLAGARLCVQLSHSSRSCSFPPKDARAEAKFLMAGCFIVYATTYTMPTLMPFMA